MSDPDVPLEKFSYGQLENVATDVETARGSVREALETLDGEDCVGRDKLAEAYHALTYMDTAMKGILTKKMEEAEYDCQ